MTTLGKVFLFLNVALAAAVAYFATDNWARRQSLNAAGLRYALTTDGLPTEPAAGQTAALSNAPADDESVAVRLPTGTGRLTDDIPYRLLKAHFAGADGKAGAAGRPSLGSPIPPLSVKGELERVKKSVDAFLGTPNKDRNGTYEGGTLATGEQRLAWLCGTLDETTGAYAPGILTLLADGFAERLIVKRLLRLDADPEANRGREFVAEKRVRDVAGPMFERRFQALLAAPNPTGAAADLAVLTDKQKAVTAAVATVTGAHRQEQQARDAMQSDPARATEYATAKATTDKARAAMIAAFDDFESQLSQIGNGACRDDADRRRKALVLLAHLDPTDDTWQKRLVLMFGQPEYLRAQSDRIDALKPYPSLIDDERHAADAAFYAEYERLKQAAKDRDRILERQKDLLAEKRAQADDAKKLLDQQIAYHKDRDAVNTALTAQAEALAAGQKLIEAELFKLQLEVGRLLRENFDYEDQLIVAERKALSSSGR